MGTRREASALPDVGPQLATPATEPPAGPEWIHEIKYDGYRLLCRVEHGRVRLISRNAKDWSERFPGVIEAVRALPIDSALLDGEVAVVRPDGRTRFQDLQNILNGTPRGGVLRYYLFDLLHLEGRDWTREPLVRRKERLAKLLEGAEPSGILQYSDHVEGRGPEFFAQACGLDLEGIVSKRRDSPYRPGRSRDWLKIKCLNIEEFVVGGYTEPGGAREGLGALLVGGHDLDGRLRFAGRVGTGFSDAQLRDYRKRFESLEREESPFLDGPQGRAARNTHWVSPEVVVQVAFTDWTDEGLLRHPAFRGIREDRTAAEVQLPRRPADQPAAAVEGEPASPVKRPAPARRQSERRGRAGPRVAGIPITNPQKVLYPEDGVTKLELAEHYERVADHMLPWVGDRALTLVRCPDGIGDCFYQKNIEGTVPDAILKVPVKEGEDQAEYAAVDSAAGLVSLAQLGVLEVHTWGSKRQDLEHPDRFTMDFDPDPDVPWIRVVEAVLEMRGLLGELGLESYLKTTGGKGLHVVVPIRPRLGWGAVKEFSRAVAATLAADQPLRYTLSMSKDKRKGRILIDYLRNARGATAVEAYSTRARPGAPVAVPIRWEELAEGVRSDTFNIRNLSDRLDALRDDPWQGYAARQPVTPSMLKSVGID